jgi:hypothetical protein
MLADITIKYTSTYFNPCDNVMVKVVYEISYDDFVEIAEFYDTDSAQDLLIDWKADSAILFIKSQDEDGYYMRRVDRMVYNNRMRRISETRLYMNQ